MAPLTPNSTQQPLPLILIRGFGGLSVDDEKKVAYQGFNDGSVYHQIRGENYIYEGLILRLLKSNWKYFDATNVVGYYSSPVTDQPSDGIPEELEHLKDFFVGDRMVIDPAMAHYLYREIQDPLRTIWVFRYYDLNDRRISAYGKALTRLIDFIQALARSKDSASPPKVNIIAHSMGGLIVREAIQVSYPRRNDKRATECINKVVTLGTPHQGVSFQVFRNWLNIEAGDEVKHFSPEFQSDESNAAAYVNFLDFFPADRFLTVVGTNYRSYSLGSTSLLNRLFSPGGEFGTNYNRSDGLVKQKSAQIPGCPRTFVHKCHGGDDSLITSREAFEVATRFFFGNVRAKLRLLHAKITRGQDWFGKSEFFFGVSIKPRKVDFELFHQSKEAENCYGPFHKDDLSDKNIAFPWADEQRLIWDGWLDTSKVTTGDLVLRLDFYVSERDLLGIGFSDNVIFHKQYYVRAVWSPQVQLYLHADEKFAEKDFTPAPSDEIRGADTKWDFDVGGTGFKATFRIELEHL